MSVDPRPAVTVVTATYNRPETLRAAIASAFGQTFTAFEYWVIGDACDAATAAVIAEFDDPRLRYHNLATNSGNQSVPNNAGAERAQGEWLAYLNHDDLWLPWHLAALLAERQASGADLVYGLTPIIGPAGLVRCGGEPYEPGDRPWLPLCPPTSWLVRRSAIEAIGGWRAGDLLDGPVDLDVLHRLLAAGYRVSNVRRVTALHFGSGLYRDAYRTDEAATQQRYLALMQQDAAALERELLQGLALAFARHRCTLPDWRGLLRRAGALLLRGAEACWGRDRWPFPDLRRWSYQRKRRAKYRFRGTPAGGGAS